MAPRPGTDHDFWSAAAKLDPIRAVEKYERLLELASAPEDERRGLIRTLAARWPAATREAEMIGPRRTRERLASLVEASRTEPSTRAAWWEAGAGPVMLWAEVHRLLRWLQADRARGARTLADLRHERWTSLRLAPDCRLASRLAYLLLAEEMAASPPELFFVLFERAGHWDVRPGDPDIRQTKHDLI